MTLTLHHMPYVPVTWPDRRPRHLRRAMASPLGTLTLLSDGEALTGLLLRGETPATGVVGAQAESLGAQAACAATALLDAAAAQLDEYFAGRPRAFDLPLRLRGTPFQQRVWRTLLGIPYGDTLCYADVAARAAAPGRRAPPAPPWAATPSPWSCPATAWSAPTAASPATPAACPQNAPCCASSVTG